MSRIPRPRLEAIAGRLPKRVVIVGNNESAWMAAACLGRHCRSLNCRVTVLANGSPQAEFPGESSLSSLRGLCSNLQVDEHEMMQNCQATYRVASQMSDWVQADRDFWIPVTGAEHAACVSLFDLWFAERKAGRLLRPFHSYSLHWGAALGGKGPFGFGAPSEISQSGAYAYHLDGTDFAAWLRHMALASGVEEIRGEVATTAPNGRGGIAQLRLTSQTAVASDFFIDCTGRDACLIGSVRAAHDEQFNQRLKCDRMITVRHPGRRQIPAFTRVTGLDAGWSWQSPLSTTIDCGYAYNSGCATDELAWKQLQNALLLDGITTTDGLIPEYSSVECYSLQTFWQDNVLALGTTAFRIDPLVSASRHLTQMGIELFMELFPERSGSSANTSNYNERMKVAVCEAADFAHLHYALSRRADSEFWKEIAQSALSPELSQRLELFAAAGFIDRLPPEAPATAAYLHLLAGCGRLPAQPTLMARAADSARTQQGLRAILKANEAALRDLPLHEELLDWIHTGPDGQQKTA